MKYIKTYESDQKYLKVGDKVKYIRNKAMNWIDPETYLIIEIKN